MPTTNIYIYIYKYTYINMYIQQWSELLAPLENIIKEGCENESASFFYKKKCNLSLENNHLKWEEISL